MKKFLSNSKNCFAKHSKEIKNLSTSYTNICHYLNNKPVNFKLEKSYLINKGYET